MSFSSPRRFYTTEPSPCPYLPGRQEQRIVTTLAGPEAEGSLSFFTEIGFRRSQTFLYRPSCPLCSACVPVRIVVDEFRASRRFRKVLGRNGDLNVAIRPPQATDEQYELFNRYQNARHAEGTMAAMDRLDYSSMVEDAASGTMVVEFRYPSGELAGVSLTDELTNGLSGVYKFYDPAAARRSLGTFVVLWHVEHARALGLAYVYLGYWIRGSDTMSYKAQFQPLERLDRRGWHRMEPGG